MLIRFNVENFLSFNNQAEFSMIAGKERRLPNHMVKGSGINILKSAVIYGANASGKTNLVKALDFSRRLILKGIENVNTIDCHFRLAKESQEKPSVFNYEIAINDRYFSYGFGVQLNSNKILEEWLIEIGPENKERKIFERTINNAGEHTIDFGVRLDQKEKKRFDVYKQDFLHADSLLFLSEMNRKSIGDSGIGDLFVSVYAWFRDKLTVIFPQSRYSGLNFIGNDTEMANTYKQFLDVFQTGIQGITSKEVSLENFDLPDPIKKDIAQKAKTIRQLIFEINGESYALTRKENNGYKIIKIGLTHRNDNKEEVVFDVEDESDGTRRLLDFIPALHQLAKTNTTFVIDELDRSLHSKLTYNIFKLFHELSASKKSQLIATTHESLLLDLDLFRKDEIWFVEKNNNESQIYSLDEFKVRNDKIINKDYLLGRYGAIPIFKSFNNLKLA